MGFAVRFLVVGIKQNAGPALPDPAAIRIAGRESDLRTRLMEVSEKKGRIFVIGLN